ncbi:DNA-binding protein HU [Striga asiatica]|uniref:DNA-binding protein HU n=1 Tax=Striga asiatica TaxID=4170 RepID=A0A5A7R5E9_STRAF|nr:DNA-binding protein HU [Striga asiatica]
MSICMPWQRRLADLRLRFVWGLWIDHLRFLGESVMAEEGGMLTVESEMSSVVFRLFEYLSAESENPMRNQVGHKGNPDWKNSHPKLEVRKSSYRHGGAPNSWRMVETPASRNPSLPPSKSANNLSGRKKIRPSPSDIYVGATFAMLSLRSVPLPSFFFILFFSSLV